MRVLSSPQELESLLLPEPALSELRQQLAIPGYSPQELCALWQDLPARLICFKEGDLPEVLLMALLAHLPTPEYEVSLNETFRLRLYLFSDDGAGIYLVSPVYSSHEEH